MEVMVNISLSDVRFRLLRHKVAVQTTSGSFLTCDYRVKLANGAMKRESQMERQWEIEVALPFDV